MKEYVKLYKQESEACFKKWGYYYPPREWSEFETWNNKVFQEHLKEMEAQNNLLLMTKCYVALLNNTKEFGFFHAFNSCDYTLLNNVLYQTSRQKLLDRGMKSSGSDHCNVLMDALSAFSCNDFEVINHFFPKELPLSKGTYYTENAVNMLKTLYYKQSDLKDEALEKARIFLDKKLSLWEKYVVSYFISLVDRNPEQASFCLQELCSAYQKLGQNEISKLEKCFSSPVHGLYRFVREIDEPFFKEIKRPKHACFLEAFEIWQEEHGYPQGGLFYSYPKEMDYMNKIFEAELPTVALRESENKPRKEFYKDVEKFAFDLTENIKLIKYKGDDL
jgi:hypothetical protein